MNDQDRSGSENSDLREKVRKVMQPIAEAAEREAAWKMAVLEALSDIKGCLGRIEKHLEARASVIRHELTVEDRSFLRDLVRQ